MAGKGGKSVASLTGHVGMRGGRKHKRGKRK